MFGSELQGRQGSLPRIVPEIVRGEVGERRQGLLWQKFTYAGGWHSWSEQHLGELIKIENGVPVNKGKCPKCGGTSFITCELCKGTGKVICPECKGEKEIFPVCPDCKNGEVECKTCKGTGLKT